VRATTEHLVEHLGGDPARVVLLTDCMSPVAGFEAERPASWPRCSAAACAGHLRRSR
jgi:nicotinamidase/pyrazinamidase